MMPTNEVCGGGGDMIKGQGFTVEAGHFKPKDRRHMREIYLQQWTSYGYYYEYHKCNFFVCLSLFHTDNSHLTFKP